MPNRRTKLLLILLLGVFSLGNVHCHKERGGSNPKFGFQDTVKQVLKKNVTSPVGTNAGEPLKNNDRMRIIGGVETARNEFPFIVSFARDGKHFCGGAVIYPDWVLTAAHCASEPNFDVTAGEHNLNIPEGTEQKSRAVLVLRHHNYNPITYEDDICLVKVSPPFDYNNYVKPFSVPSTHYVATGNATVAGWGTEDEAFQVVSPVLRKVTVPLVASIECAAQYGSYFHPLKMICAGEEEGGKDACQGDSGGPLMCDDYHKGATLCGVVSFGLGCARPELAGVYTKVAYYSDWIDFQVRQNSGRQVPTKKTTPYYRPPVRSTNAPPPPPPGNQIPGIPPGYVVIIKPINHTHVPPTEAPHYERPRYNKTRTRYSGSSNIYSNSNFRTVLIFTWIALLLFFRLN